MLAAGSCSADVSLIATPLPARWPPAPAAQRGGVLPAGCATPVAAARARRRWRRPAARRRARRRRPGPRGRRPGAAPGAPARRRCARPSTALSVLGGPPQCRNAATAAVRTAATTTRAPPPATGEYGNESEALGLTRLTAVRATRREHDLDEGGLAGAVRADREVETHRVRYSSGLVVPSGW